MAAIALLENRDAAPVLQDLRDGEAEFAGLIRRRALVGDDAFRALDRGHLRVQRQAAILPCRAGADRQAAARPNSECSLLPARGR